MANNNNNTITACLIGAAVFLVLYLLFTGWCTKRDYYVDKSTQSVAEAMAGAYEPSTDPDYDFSPTSGKEYESLHLGYPQGPQYGSPLERFEKEELFTRPTIQGEAEADAIDFFHEMAGEPGRIDKTQAFQDAMLNQYNKDMRYC